MSETSVTWTSSTFGDVRVMERVCPHCGRNNAGTGGECYGRDIWLVVDCAGCGFSYLNRGPDYGEMFEKMAWEKSSKVEDRRRETERAAGYKLSKKTRKRLHLFPRKDIVDLIARYVTPGPVIDLGCGDGVLLSRLDNRYIPCGVEISGALAAQAETLLQGRSGRVVTAPSLDGLREFPDGYFTGAMLRSYLEHEVNPLPVLQELWRALGAGGVAVIKVPNYGSLNRRVMGGKWCGFRFPDHLNYFTPATLQRMVEEAKFKVRRFGILDRMPTSDNMWMIIEKS